MEDNVKSFLDKIQDLKEKKIKVEVVSTGKSVDCVPLTFKQQKDLISTIADGAVGALKFQKYLNSIIIENTGLSDLKTTDKLPIILKLRLEAIGNKVRVGNDEVLLDPIIGRIQILNHTQSKVLKGDFTIELEIPTLTHENNVIQATIDSLKKEGDAEIGKNIGSIYTHEIVKYIKTIKFSDQELTFADIPVKDRVKIVENLPITINREIITFIQDIKNTESELLTVEVNGESKVLDIDVNFFDS